MELTRRDRVDRQTGLRPVPEHLRERRLRSTEGGDSRGAVDLAILAALGEHAHRVAAAVGVGACVFWDDDVWGVVQEVEIIDQKADDFWFVVGESDVAVVAFLLCCQPRSLKAGEHRRRCLHAIDRSSQLRRYVGTLGRRLLDGVGGECRL